MNNNGQRKQFSCALILSIAGHVWSNIYIYCLHCQALVPVLLWVLAASGQWQLSVRKYL